MRRRLIFCHVTGSAIGSVTTLDVDVECDDAFDGLMLDVANALEQYCEGQFSVTGETEQWWATAMSEVMDPLLSKYKPDPLGVPCPLCGSASGEPCDGHETAEPHRSRRVAALAAAAEKQLNAQKGR